MSLTFMEEFFVDKNTRLCDLQQRLKNSVYRVFADTENLGQIIILLKSLCVN